MSTDQRSDETIRQAYRAAAQAEPSPQLDASILQAAHAALATPPRKSARWSWLVLPMSAAAVAILVTTVALQYRPAPSLPPQESVATNTPPHIATPAPVVVAAAKPEPAKKMAAAEQTKQKAQELKIAKAEAAPTRSLMQAQAPSSAPVLADAARAEAGAALSSEARSKAAYAPPPPAAERLAETAVQPARAPKLEGIGVLAKARSPAQPSAEQLEEIRKLKREGKVEAAKKALDELRKQFPQYKLPDDLRSLIEPVADENKAHP